MSAKRNLIVMVATRAGVCLLLILAAVALFGLLVKTKPKPAGAEDGDAVPNVTVLLARQVPVRRRWEGFGTARAMDSADVPSRVTATVSEIPEHILEGADVARNELLVRLDPGDFDRQVEISTQALADVDAQIERLRIEQKSWNDRLELVQEQVELARQEYQRLKDAFDQDAARQREVDAARQTLLEAIRVEVSTREEIDKLPTRRTSLEAQRASHEASLRQAQENLARTEIRSPITGRLSEVDVEVGENVVAGSRVARVISLERIEVPVLLPAGARQFIAVGDDVGLGSESSDRLAWNAVVARISPQDDQAMRTMTLYVEVRQSPDEAGLLSPGRFVRGSVVSHEEQFEWIVPRRSVLSGRVQLVEDDLAVEHAVEIAYHLEGVFPQFGLSDDQWVVLKNPLPEGAMVIVDAARSIPSGTRVAAVPAGSVSVTRNGGPPS